MIAEEKFKIPALFRSQRCLSKIVVCKYEDILSLALTLDTFMAKGTNGDLETYHQSIQTFYTEFTNIMSTVTVDIQDGTDNHTLLNLRSTSDRVEIYTNSKINKIILNKDIKQGAYGSVWSTTINNNNKYVTKIPKLTVANITYNGIITWVDGSEDDVEKKKRNFANNLYELSIGVLLQCIKYK